MIKIKVSEGSSGERIDKFLINYLNKDQSIKISRNQLKKYITGVFILFD